MTGSCVTYKNLTNDKINLFFNVAYLFMPNICYTHTGFKQFLSRNLQQTFIYGLLRYFIVRKNNEKLITK